MRSLSIRRGFTLIELLVVIAVIGILAAVVLTNLNSARSRARDVQRIADIKSLQLALSLFLDSNNGKYPGTLATGPGELAPTFIPNIPTPPPGLIGVNSYAYVPLDFAGGACNSYHLGASLEQINNSVLTTDADALPGTSGTSCGGVQTNKSDFNGLNYNTHCESATVGTPQPNGTEVCFDVTP